MDARSTSNTQTHSAAYFLLEGLNEIGIDYLFCNFGTDHAPIIEELANRKQRGEPVPKTIRCAHENTAAHMAAGYALMTGRGQGVLVHVDVGTANTATAMHNLFRSRLPVLLMAGKAPYTTAHELTGTRDTYVHFVQEPFDQGSLVRPYVKWEWTLPSGVVVKEALRRAHTIMQSEPRGPVYLMMARETLAQDWDEADIRRYPAEQFGGAAKGAADPELIGELAARILAAQNPMLITAYAGRNPDASRAIEELAEFAGIAVYESNFVNNISHEGPCFLGFVPDKHLPEADLGLLVDIDVPWFPRDVQQKEGSYWAQIDVDVLKTASPMWTFPSNLRLQGDSARILTQLLARLKEIATPKFREAAAARVKSFESVRTARIERAKQLASDKGKPDEINPHYLFAELAKLIEPTDIVFNEAVRNSGALALQIPRPLPGTMSRVGGGGLGSSGGMALGAKLAAPDRMMVQVVGDGSFYFNCPSSVFAAAKQYKLPFLSIVLDNTGWSAVKESTLRVFPDGKAKATKEFEAELSPDVDFAKVGEAFGAHGEKVSDPAEVPAALKRCVDAVRGGRAALLHARVTRI
jgi:acetolactate synthase-1/2/3 large subunit